MKKIVLFLIIFTTSIFLFSCGNAGVYRQFNTKFEMFKLKVSSTNQIVMDMNIEVELFESSKPLGKNGFEATIKMNESPLYIDVSAGDGSDKESYVLSQKGNDLYQHEIINENLAITEFYSSVDEYENDEYDIAFGFKFDKEKPDHNYFLLQTRWKC